MKKLIAAAVIAMASFSVLASTPGEIYAKKARASCDAVGDSFVNYAIKNTDMTTRQLIKLNDGAVLQCMISYAQASADYPIEKAKVDAKKNAGEFGPVIVKLAYAAYKKDFGLK